MKSSFELLAVIDLKNLKNARKIIADIKNISYENVVFSSKNVFLDTIELQKFSNMFARLNQGEPISKIIGKKGFWKHEFFVDENVLDPRPETELIIESVLARFADNMELPLRFLDIGTGSGCILLSLLSEFKNAMGIGIDISKKAIAIAKKNKEKLEMYRATFINIGWNEILNADNNITNADRKVMDMNIDMNIDVIVSNPPYICTDEIKSLDENVRKYDPKIALDGGIDGLEKYREITIVAKEILQKSNAQNKNKYIFLEVGYNQADDVKNLLKKNNFKNIVSEKDLNGIDRVVIARSAD